MSYQTPRNIIFSSRTDQDDDTVSNMHPFVILEAIFVELRYSETKANGFLKLIFPCTFSSNNLNKWMFKCA